MEYPKQFLRIGGLTILEHTIGVFEREPTINEIIVVGAPDWMEMTEATTRASGATKISGVIPGGKRRNDSTMIAIDYLRDRPNYRCMKVLMHDAVRPLVRQSTLRDCVRALDSHDAADVVIETADTIVEVEEGVLTGIPRRSGLRRGQTPQAFILTTLDMAYQRIEEEQLSAFTDDCAVVLAAFPDLAVATLAGSDDNIKVTTPMDIYLADRLLQGRQMDTSEVDDILLPQHVVVFGGSSGIGKAVAGGLRERGVTASVLSRENGVDVRNEAEVGTALVRLRDEVGPIGAVVNSVGVLSKGVLVELREDEIRSGLEVNLLGPVNIARASYDHLCETRGKLLFFTSSSYTRGRAEYGIYSAAKAGVVNLTQALAEEWFASGITVNCINPARTKTPMRTRAFGQEPDQSLLPASRVAEVALNVLGQPVTGHVFDVRQETA